MMKTTREIGEKLEPRRTRGRHKAGSIVTPTPTSTVICRSQNRLGPVET